MGVKSNTANIDVIILCGGMGSRLKTVIADKPKALAEIDEIPFIEFLINYVVTFGFRRFILCIGYKGEQIKKYYKYRKGNSAHCEIIFSEEKSLLGTAGAIKNAEKLIKSDTFLVINGDTFCKLNLNKFTDFHFAKRALLSMVLTKSPKARDCGNVSVGDDNRIIRFAEKVGAKKCDGLVNAGIYLMQHSLLSGIPLGAKVSLEYEIFPRIIEKGCYGFVSKSEFIDIGTPDSYKKATKFLKAGK